MSIVKTADIHDAAPELVVVCDLQFRSFGKIASFGGPCVTVKTYESHHELKEIVARPGQGCVLVIDGGASARVGLMGDGMAALAAKNGWSGAIIYGAIRDSEEINALDFGVKALFTTCRRSDEKAGCTEGGRLSFGNAIFRPGDWVYADTDAVLVRKDKFGE